MPKCNDFLNDIEYEDLSDEERELLYKDVNSSKITQTKNNSNRKQELKKFKDANKRYKS